MDPFASASSVQHHRDAAPTFVTAAILTVSDTRTLETDASGDIIRTHLSLRGHTIKHREIVKDDADAIGATLDAWIADPTIDVIITNGGTGITARDVTWNAISSRITTLMPGFGEVFRMLSWPEIGAATILSRAAAGVTNRTVVFSLPGSPNAVTLGMSKIIAPELGHIVREAQS